MNDTEKSREQLMEELVQLRRLVGELRSSEAELRDAEEQLRFMKFSVDNAPDCAFWVASDGRIIYVNKAACQSLGYTQEELHSMTLHDIDPYFPAELWPEKWALTVRGGSFKFESKHRAKDGRLIPVEVMSTYLEFNGKGYACAFARDLSERKQTEKKLVESETRLRAIFEAEPECVSLMDPQGTMLAMNPAGLSILEADSPDQVIGKQWPSFAAPEHFEATREFSARVFSGETASHEFEVIGLKGTRRWLEAHAKPLRNENDETISMVAITHDITERRKSETALRESEQRYRELFETASDVIMSMDLAGNLTSINKMAEKVSGFTSAELLESNISRLLAPEHFALSRKMLDGMLAGESLPSFYEMELITREGIRVPIEVNPALIYRGGKPVGAQVVARDITERMRLQEQLQQSQKLEAIGRLAGGVAHDFNNLLTAILGYSDLLLGEIETDSALQSDVEAIKRAADRAAMLTRQLLAFSRRQILSPQILNLNDVVANVEKMLRRVIGEDIELAITPGRDLAKVKADPGQIEQILLNLAVNSRDAMPDGGRLSIETTNAVLSETEALEQGAIAAGRYVIMVVSDTGTGIDPKTRPHIFEPFFTTKEPGKGTGLGLSTVYGIVRQSGGHISVESEPGKGTTFRIFIPQMEVLKLTEEPAHRPPASIRGAETILVVEDEDVVRDLVGNLLRSFGYNVLEAKQGKEALQILQRELNKIDLVLTDIVMPIMGGRQLGEHLAALNPKSKILYMSGYTDAPVVRQGSLGSEAAFLQKPFSPTALGRKVREVLDS